MSSGRCDSELAVIFVFFSLPSVSPISDVFGKSSCRRFAGELLLPPLLMYVCSSLLFGLSLGFVLESSLFLEVSFLFDPFLFLKFPFVVGYFFQPAFVLELFAGDCFFVVTVPSYVSHTIASKANIPEFFKSHIHLFFFPL